MTGRVVLGLAASLAVFACSGERERLAPPRVSLVLNDSVVGPGGSVTGHARAADESGLIYFVVRAMTPDSVFNTAAYNFVRTDSVDTDFNLHVSTAADGGQWVRVEAVAIDDQNFTVSAVDSARVVLPAPLARP